MANVKKVEIRGEMPFNILDDADARFLRYFAEMSTPTWGLGVEYDRRRAPRMVPNEHGGQTAYYRFRIHGAEAMSWLNLDWFVAEMAKQGVLFYTASAYDEADDFRTAYDLLGHIPEDKIIPEKSLGFGRRWRRW